MKLEQLASLLGKDATELQGSLNLENQAEVPDEILTRELTNFTKELSITKFNEGKKQGEGMAKRLVMTEAEKTLKDTFGVDGSNFNELVENLKGLKSESKADEKLLKERDQWKATALGKDTEIQNLKTQFETIQVTEKIKTQIVPKLDKFDFATSKVREVAVNDFIQNRKFKIEGSDIFIERNDAFFTLSDNEIENHFKEYGTIKQSKGNGTPPRNTGTSYGTSKADLFKEIDKATTPEEVARLREELAALEN
jgi:hypothetical protein